MLFGNILAMDDQTLLVIAFNATITLLVMAVIYRPLVIECVDPVFLRTVSRAGAPAHLAFLALVVINLVNGFHALGTLLGVGLMILPAGIARFWSRDITGMICIAVASAIVSGYAGLVLSFQTRIPSGPAIILVAAVLYIALAVVRPGQRPGPADVPRPSSRGVAMMRRLFWLLLWPLIAATSSGRAPRIASTSSPASRSSAISSAMSAATASASRRWSAPIATRMSTRRRRRMPRSIADAKLVFVNGLGFEGWLPRLVKSAGGKAAIVTATSGIAPLKLGSDADPHAWQSVANAKIYVANIRDALAAADPADAEVFKRQCDAYLADLDALDREVREAIAQIPEGRRKVISTHDAFGYFAAAYGVEFIAPVGVSTESEASARDIAGDHHPDQDRQNTGGFPGKYQRPPADPPDIGRDRRQGRRNAVFGQSDRRKGRCSHLH